MARRRQARRCKAHRRDGQPCRAYAINGGVVCTKHGGAAPQVRRAAEARVVKQQFDRSFYPAYARWQRELAEWRVSRIVEAARLLDIDVDDVTPSDVVVCVAFHGLPSQDDAPKIRFDGRYGPRLGRRKTA